MDSFPYLVLAIAIRNAMAKGLHSKPTPRSVKVRLRGNALRGFGKEEAFLSAWIVTLSRTMAVKVRRMFKTELTM